MIAIGIGDLHLTSTTGQGALSQYVPNPDRYVASEVNRVLQDAKEKGVSNIFLYGDLCEGTRMSYDAQLALLSILRQDFDFHVILGNHDLFAEDPAAGHSLQLIKEFALPNVKIYEEPTDVEIDGAPVRFLPWPHMNFSKSRLNVFHNDVQGAKTDNGRLISKGSASQAYAVGGHIHTNQRVRNTFYSGTLYQTCFGERKEKYYHLIEYDNCWEITDVPFKPRYTLRTVRVSTKKQLAAVPRLKRDLIRLVLEDSYAPAPEDLVGLNVVMVKTSSDAHKQALENLVELKNSGSEVNMSTDEFFHAWVQEQSVEDSLKTRAIKHRQQVLKSIGK